MSSTPPDAPNEAPAAVHRRRWWLFRVAMLLVVLAGQEALFRLLFPLPDAEGFNRIRYQALSPSHPNYGGAAARGLVYDRLVLESRPDGFVETHNLNLRGFRGPDFAIEPDPNRRRILVIGDSVTEGMGVDDARTFPAVWSRMLADEGVSAEVVNLGVMGAGLPQLWPLVRDSVSLLQPADVVVMLYANDLPASESSDTTFQAPGPEFPRSAAPWWRPRLAVLIDRVIVEKPIYRRWPQFPGRFFAPVPDPSNPWSGDKKRPEELSERLYRDMAAGKLNPFVHFQAEEIPGPLAYDFDRWGSPKAFLKHMAEVCQRHGARLIVGYTPFCGVVHGRYAGPLIELGMDPATAEALSTDPKYRSQNKILAEICGELGITLVDATEALEAAEAAGRAQYWAYDSHPNPDGYATIAARVHDGWRSAVGEGSRPGN